MESNITHYFYNKLIQNFENNIKFSFISEKNIIIITNEDKFYEFSRNAINNSLLIFSKNKSIIKQKINESLIEELSYKGIIEFKNSNYHTIARTSNGKIYCWGSKTDGILGNIIEDGYSISNKPELNKNLEDKYIIEMSCGLGHTLVLTKDRKVYSWGLNNMGQVGNSKSGINQRESTPYLVQLNGEKVISISCGLWHSMALTVSGIVFSWGNNCFGQLGRECQNECEKNTPKLIEFSENVIIAKICCGSLHNLLLSCEGEIYVFGSNEKGELGLISSKRIQLYPIKLNILPKFKEISAYSRSHFSSALSNNDIYYIWGEVNDKIIYKPKESPFKSFNEILMNLIEITFKPVKDKVIKFKDNFLRRGYYEKVFLDIKDIKNPLDKGDFGEVFAVQYKDFSKKKRAIKLMKLNISNQRYEDSKINSILKELENFSNIKELNNEKLVKYYDLWLEKKHQIIKGELIFVYIEMELCDKSLKNFMEEIMNDNRVVNNNCLTLVGYYISSQLFIQILEGVNYLHTRNPPLIHKDLNPYNILLKINDKSNSIVKIAGFGLAGLHKYEDQSHTTHRGHWRYIAPEVEQENYKITTKYGTKTDIYSLGVVLKELFQIDVKRDYNPYEDENAEDLKVKYEGLVELINMTTILFPTKRKSCEQILKEKDLWALNKKNFNIEKVCEEFFKNNCKEKDNQIYINNLLNKLILTIHMSIECDECKVSPIVGIRYNCNVCDNYNLCESCVERSDLKHSELKHIFIKIDEAIDTLVTNIEDLALNKELDKEEILSDDYGSFINRFKKVDIKGLTDKVKKKALQELKVLAKLQNNKYIVQYKNAWIVKNEVIFIQSMLSCFGMTLSDVMSRKRNHFERKVNHTMCLTEYYISSELFREILECINFLHKIKPKPIIHRALQPTNILIAHDTNNNRFVKLYNFDLAVVHENDNQSHTKQASSKYSAPEVLKRNYDTKSDIYSLGVITQELFDINNHASSTMQAIINSDLKEKYKFVFNIINEMLSSKIIDRPDCEKLLSEPNRLKWSISYEELKSDSQFDSFLKKSTETSSIKENFCYYFLKTKLKN